jgi:PAS domain S-box-containing protein
MTESTVESSAETILDVAKTLRIRVLHVDDDRAFLSIAKQCLEMQGEIDVDTVSSVYEASEKLKKTDYDVIVCDYQMPGKDGLEFLKELRANGNTVPFIVFTGKGREEIAVKALNLGADQYVDKHGDPETVYCELAHSIKTASGNKKAEDAKRRSEERYRTLLESISDSVYVLDREWRHVIVNEATANFTRTPREKLLGNKLTDLFPGVEKTPFFAAFKRVMETRKPETVSGKYVFEDGREGWCEVHVYPVPEGILCISTDIASRKKTEEELRASEEKLRDVFAASPDAITVTDLNGNIVECNQATVALHGYESKEELIGRNSLELIAKKDHKRAIEGLKETLEHGSTKNVEYTFLTKDGSEFPAELDASVVKDASGKPEYLMATTKDITERKKAEEALRQSMESYRELTESISDMFFAMDKDFRYTYWNKASEELTGTSAKDAIGKSLTEVFPDVKGTRVEQVYKEALRTQQPRSFLNKYQLRGKDYVFELNAYPTKTGLSVFVRDVTEREKMEQQLRIEETAVASSINAFAFADLEGKLTYVNSSFLEMWGYANENEVLGRPAEDFWSSKENAVEVVKALEHKGGWVGDLMAKKKDGSTFEVQLSASMVKDKTGKPSCMMGSFTDVTERSKMERKLRESEEKFRDLFENANDAMIHLDGSGRILDVNRRTIEVFGGTREELIGKHFAKLDIFSIKETPMLMRNFADVLTGKKARLDVSIKNKKGQDIALECSVSLVKTGELVYIVVIVRDVSERKKTEEELRNSEERLSILFELAPDAYYLNDLRGNFIDGNKAAEEVTGYTKNELIGKSFLKLKLLARSQALKAAKLLAMNALGKPTGPDEFVLNRKDGAQVPVEIRTHPVKIKGKTLVLGIARDITIRKKDEQAILENQQKFEGLFRHNPEAAVYLGLDFKVLDVNPRFCELFGYSEKEVEGKHINEVVVPEDMIEEAETLDKDAKKGHASRDTVRKRKGGSLVHVSISATPVTIEGRLFGYVGVYKDITDLKNAGEHLKEINKKLEVTNEKLHVVGGLTRHDVRNKLSAVTGNAYLLRRKLTEDPKALEQLADMEAAVRLVEQIFEFARNYEKLGVEQLACMDVGKAVDGAVSLFSDLKGVKIVNECEGLTALADSLLSQLFYNLIDNSLKYGEKTQQIKVYYKTSSTNQLELVYEDDGVGIPDNMRSNLFKEGFTSGKGTGYGLFMIKRICEVYGWNIQETGIQGKGVKFVITIPKTNPSGKENYLLDGER